MADRLAHGVPSGSRSRTTLPEVGSTPTPTGALEENFRDTNAILQRGIDHRESFID